MHRVIPIVFCILWSLNCFSQNRELTPIKDTLKFKAKLISIAKQTNSIKCDFIQEKNMSMISEKITSKGRFWYKKDNKVRMEYSHPFQYLIILNQNRIYIKDQSKENTISTNGNKLFKQISNIISDCVQGTILINPEFKTNLLESENAYYIEMFPSSKGLKDFFKSINITVDRINYTVSMVELIELSGDNTIISFLNRENNTVIPDALFYIK